MAYKQGRTKYNVDKNIEKRTLHGRVYDSEGEMKFFRDCLLPMLHRGEFTHIGLQKEFVLQEGFEHDGKKERPIVYVADFVLHFPDGHMVALDFKGMADSVAKLKRKMFWKRYPDIPLYWVSYSKIDGGYQLYETIQANRRQRKKERKAKENG